MDGCRECGEPGCLTLVAWPERSTHSKRYSARRRYYLCIYCGHKVYVYDYRKPGTTAIFTEEDVERMKYMYLAPPDGLGMTSSEIGQIMHSFPTTIRKYLRSNGVKLRPKGGSKKGRNLTTLQLKQIEFLYWRLEWSIEMVAEKLNMNPATVRHRMDVGGIPRRSLSEANRASVRGSRFRGLGHGTDPVAITAHLRAQASSSGADILGRDAVPFSHSAASPRRGDSPALRTRSDDAVPVSP